MCFSASASFTTSAILIPTGIYCLTEANKRDRAYLSFASLPFFFGIQQGFEGLLWLNILDKSTVYVTNFALCFLFFSHFFWLIAMPFSAFCVENNPLLRSILKIFTLMGFIYGSLLYFPLLIDRNWIQVTVTNHSINYRIESLFSQVMLPNFSFYIYAIIIIVPLMIASSRQINILGILLTSGIFITYLSFYYAFISVWCFMAAIVSIYLFYTIRSISHPNSSQA